MLIGYQRMPDAELLRWQWLSLATPPQALLGRPGLRVCCDACGEEVINQRELSRGSRLLCRACTGDTYYRPCVAAAVHPIRKTPGPGCENR